MTGEAREKGVPARFFKNVDEFYKESEAIFKEFDAIHEKYLRGEDITGALREFRLKRAGIFLLIDAIFHKEAELEEKLEKAEIEREKREKILEFKDRFADLADEIDLFVLEEMGVGQW
ncbi:MAG: hypothetical protein ACXQTW_06895 [Candidatus Methanospirareceae archaeon]